ncbi:MAG: membrane integrity-associated transporter subunit PqiC [Ferruginibacter sp.]|nr:membrane integrity-associated transporter subunit PqiC [Rhodoferax sp.]
MNHRPLSSIPLPPAGETQGRCGGLLVPLAALLLTLALTGCATPPAVHYYSLAPSLQPAPASTLQVEIPPIALPERLVRPQLVVRSAANPFDVLQQHRWAAPFDSELHDALASGITQQLGAIDVTAGGRLASQPVYRIAVQLRQWDAAVDSQVQASFSWTIRRADGNGNGSRNLACQWSQSEPVAPGIAALAQGAQRLTSRAAQSMAASVKALDADAAATCLD